MINIIKEKFFTRTAREQKLILLILGLVAITFFISFMQSLPMLFKPSIRTEIENKKSSFEELLPVIAESKSLKIQAKAYKRGNEMDLYKFISDDKPSLNVLNNDEMVINRIDEKVEIKYQSVSFDDLIKWLEKLQKQNGVNVFNATITSIETEVGFVKADIVLQ